MVNGGWKVKEIPVLDSFFQIFDKLRKIQVVRLLCCVFLYAGISDINR